MIPLDSPGPGTFWVVLGVAFCVACIALFAAPAIRIICRVWRARSTAGMPVRVIGLSAVLWFVVALFSWILVRGVWTGTTLGVVCAPDAMSVRFSGLCPDKRIARQDIRSIRYSRKNMGWFGFAIADRPSLVIDQADGTRTELSSESRSPEAVAKWKAAAEALAQWAGTGTRNGDATE